MFSGVRCFDFSNFRFGLVNTWEAASNTFQVVQSDPTHPFLSEPSHVEGVNASFQWHRLFEENLRNPFDSRLLHIKWPVVRQSGKRTIQRTVIRHLKMSLPMLADSAKYFPLGENSTAHVPTCILDCQWQASVWVISVWNQRQIYPEKVSNVTFSIGPT